jgi:hypothetical protein
MRPRTSHFGASADAEVIWNAIAAQLRACYDASRPLPANIDTLLQRLISRDTEGEATNSHEDNVSQANAFVEETVEQRAPCSCHRQTLTKD